MHRLYLSALLTLIASVALVACATGSQAEGDDEQQARGGPPRCTMQDIGPAGNVRVQTCVEPYGPETLPEEMQPRHPYVVTVVDTPYGTFSNPLRWSFELIRDGEVVFTRDFEESETTVERTGDRTQIRSTVPLPEQVEIEPGIYEFRYLDSEAGELGTTTIEVEEPEEGGEAEEPQ